MLTIVCVWVAGPVQYTAEYVTRLFQMVSRFAPRPFQFVCLTDRPFERFDAAEIQTRHIESMRGLVPENGAGYWAKVRLFDSAWQFAGRVLYLDLDSIIVSGLSSIVDYPAPFAITEDALVKERAHLNTDRYGRKLVRAFNSSVMVWDSGFGRDIFDAWTPAVAQDLSTDQDWIAERYPQAAAMPYAWFPRVSQVRPPWPVDAKVVLCKKPKNHEAIIRWPELDAWWRGSAA